MRRWRPDAPDATLWQRWPFRSYAAKKFFATADSIDLPDYWWEG